MRTWVSWLPAAADALSVTLAPVYVPPAAAVNVAPSAMPVRESVGRRERVGHVDGSTAAEALGLLCASPP